MAGSMLNAKVSRLLLELLLLWLCSCISVADKKAKRKGIHICWLTFPSREQLLSDLIFSLFKSCSFDTAENKKSQT